MRRSKLEMYIDILKVLEYRGPQKLTDVMYRANVNNSVLKRYLKFMIKQNLVGKKKIGKKRVVYVITQRGMTFLEAFNELKGKYIHPTVIRKSKYIKNKREKNDF